MLRHACLPAFRPDRAPLPPPVALPPWQELWTLLISANQTGTGIPQRFYRSFTRRSANDTVINHYHPFTAHYLRDWIKFQRNGYFPALLIRFYEGAGNIAIFYKSY